MAKQIEGVYEAILSCAKKEFLEKGYKDASLRVIAQEAGTSTGSIYTRFGDKEGLFEAIVGPAAGQLTEMFLKIQKDFHNLNEDTQRAEMGKYTSEHQIDMLDFIYDHFDEFRLLLDCAEGTRFSAFLGLHLQIYGSHWMRERKIWTDHRGIYPHCHDRLFQRHVRGRAAQDEEG